MIKKAHLLIVASVLLASPVHADTTIKVDTTLCQSLVNYQPDDGVAYKPGLDADGNKVAPADLPGTQQIQMPKKIAIPLTINLAQSLNLNTSAYPYNQLGQGTEAVLGTLTVEGNKVLFNGQPLSNQQQDKLSALCNHQK